MAKSFSLRRLVQLRLATLLAVVTLSCLAMATYRFYVRAFVNQAQAAKRIRALGGSVQFETPSPAWLASIIGRDKYRNVIEIDLQHCRVRDAQLSALRDTPHVRRLYLAGNPISDSGLQHIAHLKKVERLALWGTRVTDEGLKHLADFTNLKALDVHRTGVSDAGLKTIAKHAELEELILGSRVTNAGMSELAKLRKLWRLDLQHASVTVEGIQHLGGANIKWLASPGWHIRGADLVHFQDLVQLHALPGTVIDCTDEDLRHLARLRRLKYLGLSGAITDEGFRSLLMLPSIERLEISGYITSEGLRALNRTNLRQANIVTPCITLSDMETVLSYSGSPTVHVITPWIFPHQIRAAQVRNLVIAPVARLKNFGSVNGVELGDFDGLITDWTPLLEHPNITDLTLFTSTGRPVPADVIRQMPNLKVFNYYGDTATSEDVARVFENETIKCAAYSLRFAPKQVPLGQLEGNAIWDGHCLLLVRCGLPQSDIDLVKEVADSTLHLSGYRFYADPFTEVTALLSNKKPALALLEGTSEWDLSVLSKYRTVHRLMLRNCRFQSEQWQQIWQTPGLKELDIDDCELVFGDLVGIGALQELKRLRLHGVYLSDQEAAVFGKLPSLQELTIRDPGIDGQCFANFRNLQDLRVLNLAGTSLKDSWIKELQHLQSLEELDLSGTPLTNAAIDDLLLIPNLRKCNVRDTLITANQESRLAKELELSTAP